MDDRYHNYSKMALRKLYISKFLTNDFEKMRTSWMMSGIVCALLNTIFNPYRSQCSDHEISIGHDVLALKKQ